MTPQEWIMLIGGALWLAERYFARQRRKADLLTVLAQLRKERGR